MLREEKRIIRSISETMWLKNSSNETFEMFAVKNYNNPCCSSIVEFREDLKRIIYIQKQLTRYNNTNGINYRLFLNNVICFFNVFDLFSAKMMLLSRISEINHKELKATLSFLMFIDPEIELIDVESDIDFLKKLDEETTNNSH